jgi:hypothetical protein
LDIYSRYVVGWMVASRESKILAERLFAETIAKQGIQADQLTIHADRGSSMMSKPVAFLLADLGVTKSHSRPHVSNDNPYSESQFRTLKYRPDFPDRFTCIEESRVFCGRFFPWYNHDHRHSGLGLHTPADVHYGRAEAVRTARAGVLEAAYAANPERFVRKPPEPPKTARGRVDQQAARARRRTTQAAAPRPPGRPACVTLSPPHPQHPTRPACVTLRPPQSGTGSSAAAAATSPSPPSRACSATPSPAHRPASAAPPAAPQPGAADEPASPKTPHANATAAPPAT